MAAADPSGGGPVADVEAEEVVAVEVRPQEVDLMGADVYCAAAVALNAAPTQAGGLAAEERTAPLISLDDDAADADIGFLLGPTAGSNGVGEMPTGRLDLPDVAPRVQNGGPSLPAHGFPNILEQVKEEEEEEEEEPPKVRSGMKDRAARDGTAASVGYVRDPSDAKRSGEVKDEEMRTATSSSSTSAQVSGFGRGSSLRNIRGRTERWWLSREMGT